MKNAQESFTLGQVQAISFRLAKLLFQAQLWPSAVVP
jgi:hypothetical protein